MRLLENGLWDTTDKVLIVAMFVLMMVSMMILAYDRRDR
jgi:hypothetical protein